ncbi:ATP-dependent zinc protease [Oceanospirillum sp. D5]|uniref:ATP-dependent zinc protease n=2 Tax=Oceanospirillum sediminis TaxID=2760088 RepID=A0A839IJJ7_9GAMM|nr:ATP-dependent zinc protease [Oceanospirillum sediminis]
MVASRQEPASKRPTEIEQNGLSRNYDRLILGSREWVWIDSIAQHLKARVDSGATTSSLSAFNQVLFERNGKKWVRFKLEEGGDALSVEAPLLRWAYVQQASSDKPDKRAVVELWIQVGGVREKAEFTLSDRRKMTYPVLLGREFFKDIALIDVGKSYIQGKQRPMTETDASDSSDTHISPSDPAASEAPEDTKDRKS